MNLHQGVGGGCSDLLGAAATDTGATWPGTRVLAVMLGPVIHGSTPAALADTTADVTAELSDVIPGLRLALGRSAQLGPATSIHLSRRPAGPARRA
jgi:hypothetical protein